MHLSPCSTILPVERGNIPARQDQGVAEEDIDYHCTDATMGIRSRESLIDHGRHIQAYATNTTNNLISNRRVNYKKRWSKMFNKQYYNAQSHFTE